MNTIKLSVLAAVSAVTMSAFADWNINAGYAWRQQVKTTFGGAASSASAGGAYEDGHINLGGTAADGYPDWDGGTIGSVPSQTVPSQNDYTLILTGSESVGSGSDDDYAHGFTFSGSYDFYESDLFSLAAALRFAGYWSMDSSCAGGNATYRDSFRFTSLLDGIDPYPDRTNYDAPDSYVGREYLTGGPGSWVTVKSDLYQIGIGPKATWHLLQCLELYCGVEALINIINTDLDAGSASTSQTDCKLGFGGNVGLIGWITPNVSCFGQVGYEWIDKTEVSAGGVSAETDYSSLVLSAGVQVRF